MDAVTLATTSLGGPLRKRDSHLWARDAHDFYCEPRWTADRLFQMQPFVGEVIDPACGTGRIVEAARRAHHCAEGWDILDRGFPGTKVRDFLTVQTPICNFVCNPPFQIAEQFVMRALALAHHNVAMLLPATWLLGDRRARWLETTPLVRVLFITPRPSMPPGAVIMAGQKPGNGTTDYAWVVDDYPYGFQLDRVHRDTGAGRGRPAPSERESSIFVEIDE